MPQTCRSHLAESSLDLKRIRVDYHHSMDDLKVRWATLEDARGVATVHVDSWRATYRGLIAEDVLDGLRVDQRTDGWSRWIASSLAGRPTDSGAESSHRLLVAEADGRIVGWAGFGAGRDEEMAHLGELAGLYAHPDYWSQQIGHALATRVEQELRAAGYDKAYLWVLRGNDRAIRFYEQHGWHADGAEKVDDTGSAHQLHELRHIRDLR
jgi:GNAT superfamily N-acetyltransferase